ncbi:hypothetical protein LTR17_004667 [Elasticomyces elasticus]|nr:hypothetical protein LTR17_004667 [Elasticomyces elasticus]
MSTPSIPPLRGDKAQSRAQAANMSNNKNEWLQAYQLRLMELERQNKNRLLMAREDEKRRLVLEAKRKAVPRERRANDGAKL